MFEFLLTHNHTDNPTALSILIAVISSFFLASLIIITFELTTDGIKQPAYFLQSLVLIAIAAATVMQAIGDSLARGLGMLGALAIIRFRTKLDNPRNMAFMFAAIGTGIASGVYGFTIAFIGTIGFCSTAFILKASPLSNIERLTGTLKIEVPITSNTEKEVEKILANYCHKIIIEEVRFLNLRKKGKIKDLAGNVVEEVALEKLKELHYSLRLKKSKSEEKLMSELEELPDLRNLRLKFGRTTDIL